MCDFHNLKRLVAMLDLVQYGENVDQKENESANLNVDRGERWRRVKGGQTCDLRGVTTEPMLWALHGLCGGHDMSCVVGIT